METLVIDSGHISEIIQEYGRDEIMDQVIAKLRRHFQRPPGRRGATPARTGFARDEVTGVLEWMPHHQPGQSVTIKTVSYSPLNPVRHGLPTITGLLTRFDDDTGRLTALCDGIFPTAIRTGAASVIASELLAVQDARVLGLIGAGAQAVTQAHALSRAFPLVDILVHDIDDAHAKSFPERVGFLEASVRVADLDEIESRADIICTATSVEVGAGPVFPGIGLLEHVHINAIGADLPGKFEVPEHVLRGAMVVPDHLAQARREGECQQLADREIALTLHDLVANRPLAKSWRAHRTVFDSTGSALEDHAALEVVIGMATEAGIGSRMRIEHLPVDALNPYAPGAGVAAEMAG